MPNQNTPLCWIQMRSSGLGNALAFASILATVAAGALAQEPQLKKGYWQMYDLDFPGAHRTFQAYQSRQPADPFGAVSDAAAYLFGEFERLGILKSQFLTNNSELLATSRVPADPVTTKKFEAALQKGDTSARKVLSKNPHDANAMFSQVIRLGLQADYLALIERRNLQALSTIKESRVLANELLKRYPGTYADAYLAEGIENYLLSLRAAPIRWLLRKTGSETDLATGLADLRLTAQRGEYLAPYAKILLAIAALRAKNKNEARMYLRSLADQFPHNPLYRNELSRLK